VVKIGLDWCLKKKEKDGIEVCPEETVGMKRLKQLSDDEQRKAFKTYAVPRIKDARKSKGHKGFISHWKDMAFERWTKEYAEAFLEWDMPEIMKDMPRTFGPFQAMAGWMSFRGKCVGFCELIPSDIREEAYRDMEPHQMLDYADRLEHHATQWEKNNAELLLAADKNNEKISAWKSDNDWTFLISMHDKQKAKHEERMLEKYGNEFICLLKSLNDAQYSDYSILKDAITWLRFWGERGHGMHAWY
jgi:hypothetical protein